MMFSNRILRVSYSSSVSVSSGPRQRDESLMCCGACRSNSAEPAGLATLVSVEYEYVRSPKTTNIFNVCHLGLRKLIACVSHSVCNVCVVFNAAS